MSRPITESTIASIKAIANLGSLTGDRYPYFDTATTAALGVITAWARVNALTATSGNDLLTAINSQLMQLVTDGGYVKGGTWTPVLTFATPGDLARTYTTQFGDYVKIGGLVIINFNIVTATFTWTTASGALRVTGLPFTSATTTNLAQRGALGIGGLNKSGYTQANCGVASNTTNVTFTASGASVGESSIVAADIPTGGVSASGVISLRGTVAYHT